MKINEICILIKIIAEHILKIKIMHYIQIIIIPDNSMLGSL